MPLLWGFLWPTMLTLLVGRHSEAELWLHGPRVYGWPLFQEWGFISISATPAYRSHPRGDTFLYYRRLVCVFAPHIPQYFRISLR